METSNSALKNARAALAATGRRAAARPARHYYASVMLAGGVSVRELAKYLGHADPGFTLRVYAHMMPGSHDRARKAIDDRMPRPHAIGQGGLD
ncbi:tyrosine-type recombinase/integrase [Nonomuraea glycinis]|nr:tyrosine-type recombinase/integrase [Nonomuraea glycinis]